MIRRRGCRSPDFCQYLRRCGFGRKYDLRPARHGVARRDDGWRALGDGCNLWAALDELHAMTGRRTIAAWAPAILSVFALLFASSPVMAWQTPAAPMAMAMAPADDTGSDSPCDPVKMTCARLCAVLCHGLVPTPAAIAHLTPAAGPRPSSPVDPLAGVDPEAEDPPPRA